MILEKLDLEALDKELEKLELNYSIDFSSIPLKVLDSLEDALDLYVDFHRIYNTEREDRVKTVLTLRDYIRVEMHRRYQEEDLDESIKQEWKKLLEID